VANFEIFHRFETPINQVVLNRLIKYKGKIPGFYILYNEVNNTCTFNISWETNIEYLAEKTNLNTYTFYQFRHEDLWVPESDFGKDLELYEIFINEGSPSLFKVCTILDEYTIKSLDEIDSILNETTDYCGEYEPLVNRTDSHFILDSLEIIKSTDGGPDEISISKSKLENTIEKYKSKLLENLFFNKG